MELYFFRHGIAEELKANQVDSNRRLTPKGKKKTTLIAERLQQVGLGFDVILTSPLVRAQETAQILLAQGLSPHLEIFSPLAPGSNILEGFQSLSETYENRSGRCLALVGHQPDLDNWAATLVYGRVQEKLVVKKAGVIEVRLPQLNAEPGEGHLFLLTPPRWLLGN